MRVAIFIDWFAPAYKAGGPIQSIVNLVNQKIEGIEYKIICSNKDLDGKPLTGVPFDTWVRFNDSTEVWYNTQNKKMFALLKELNSWKADIFFINGIYSFYYNFLPIVVGKADRKIISARGMLHEGALSQKSFKKNIYLSLWKLLRIPKTKTFHATNREEETFIRNVFGQQTAIHIAPNLPRFFYSSNQTPKQENTLQLISVGLISPMKNYAEVFKALSFCKERIEYTVYGAIKDPVYWQHCMDLIKTLPPNIQVHYRGDLPSSSVEEALNKAHVFILPSKSENFGHAIFEALTAGRPVITSCNTPWNRLKETQAGFNVAVENISEISTAISFFAKADQSILAAWSEGAKQYARQAIDVDHITSQYKRMFSTYSV